MAATFGAAARAPFAAIIFLFELTRDYNAILPLMLATVIADLLARRLVQHSIMTEKLARRGVTVPGAYHADPLRATLVASVMQRDVVTVAADTPLAEAERVVSASGHEAVPVVDAGGALSGILSSGDLLEPDLDPTWPVAKVATRDVVAVGAGESVYTALTRMVEEGVDHLPVVDGGRLIGMCTRADLLQVRIRELDQERVELGWLRRGRTVDGDGRGVPSAATAPPPSERPSAPPPSPNGRTRSIDA
jgi:CBS domain-containing protein